MTQTSKINLLTRLIRLTAIVPLPLGLFTVVMSPFPAIAGGWNQFDVCMTELKKYDVEVDQAATAFL
ncbi:MAG TPA: hypothetical protein DCF68_15925, partial [Cyanothece sp. UBA12306]|nr:hypothetical protein [Cyanothece sp. UBA12306]